MNRTIPLTVVLLAVLSSAAICLQTDESDADPSASTWYCYGSTMIMQYPYDPTGVTVTWTVTPYVGDAAQTAITLEGPNMEQSIDDSWTHATVEQVAVKDGDSASSTTDVVFVHARSDITVRFWNLGEVVSTRTLGGTASVKLGNAFVDVPQAPARNGYTFMGWFSDSACTQVFDPKTPILSNLDVFAGWSASSGGDNPGTKVDVGGYMVVFQAINGLEYDIVERTEDSISFTVSRSEGHIFDMSGIKVLANGLPLTPEGSVYTISDISRDIYVTVSGVELFTIEYDLRNVILSSSDGIAHSITASGPYHAEVSPESGWKGLSIKVYMGGRDVTSSCVDGGSISIEKVTANVVIVAEAESHWILFAIGGAAIAVLAIVAVAAVLIRRRHNA